jgi:hypothetical protein
MGGVGRAANREHIKPRRILSSSPGDPWTRSRRHAGDGRLGHGQRRPEGGFGLCQESLRGCLQDVARNACEQIRRQLAKSQDLRLRAAAMDEQGAAMGKEFLALGVAKLRSLSDPFQPNRREASRKIMVGPFRRTHRAASWQGCLG